MINGFKPVMYGKTLKNIDFVQFSVVMTSGGGQDDVTGQKNFTIIFYTIFVHYSHPKHFQFPKSGKNATP